MAVEARTQRVTPKVLIFSVLVFGLAGVGNLLLVRSTSESQRVRCIEFCKAKGYRSISAPTGTAGRMVDGNSIPPDAPNFCGCIPEDVKSAAP